MLNDSRDLVGIVTELNVIDYKLQLLHTAAQERNNMKMNQNASNDNQVNSQHRQSEEDSLHAPSYTPQDFE